MIQCIQYRKSTFLGNPDWLTIPWSQTSKDIYQQLYDKGFKLAALLQKIDNAKLKNEDANTSIMSEHLGGLSDLDEEMDLWYLEIIKESPSPLFWHTRPTTGDSNSEESFIPRTPPPFTFHSLRFANIVGTYWSLKLHLSNNIALECKHVLSINAQRPLQSASSTSLENEMSQDLEIMSLHLLEKYTSAHRLELATNIIRSMPYCLKDDMGLLGAQKSLFALRTALFVLRLYPSEELKLKWCQTMYQDLYNRKGLRYAREIAKTDGRHIAASRQHIPRDTSSPVRPGGSLVKCVER